MRDNDLNVKYVVCDNTAAGSRSSVKPETTTPLVDFKKSPDKLNFTQKQT